MKTNTALILLSILFTLSFQSCNKERDSSPDDLTLPQTQVARMEDILNGDDQNLIDLLDKVRGSVGTRGPASKTIWSRKNDYGLGLYISANHVYNLSGWNNRNADFFDLSRENPGIFETSQIPPTDGNIILGNTQIADFPLMHFAISPDATNTTILPAEDFYLGIVDNQRIERGPLPRHPELIQTSPPLQMYDPDNRTRADQTWNIPVAGEQATAIGYPQDKVTYPNGAISTGKILSDVEALSMIVELKAAGDSEGDVPYNPDAEFFIEAQALAGMSGGGVFNLEGQLLGIMVRASDTENAPKIIRTVKVSFIRSKMVEFYNNLPEADQNKLRPFISGEL